MSINLKKLNEEQLWDLYAHEIEYASKIKGEINRRLSNPQLKVVRNRKFKKRYF